MGKLRNRTMGVEVQLSNPYSSTITYNNYYFLFNLLDISVLYVQTYAHSDSIEVLFLFVVFYLKKNTPTGITYDVKLMYKLFICILLLYVLLCHTD